MAKRILALDDDEDVLLLLQRILEGHGYEVAIALDSATARQKMREKIPNLIFLDIIMPDSDGLQILESLKSNPMTKDIPVIMLTAAGRTGNIFRAEELKASDFFIKPFTAEELLRIVGKYI